MTIYEFVANEMIKRIEENIEYIDNFDDMWDILVYQIGNKPYEYWDQEAIQMLKDYQEYFLDRLCENCKNEEFEYSICENVVSIVKDLSYSIIERRHYAIDITLSNSKLSKEEKIMQLKLLILIAAQEERDTEKAQIASV